MAHSNGLSLKHNAEDDDEVKTKYQKHERRRRKTFQQICFLVGALVFLIVCLIFTFSFDSTLSPSDSMDSPMSHDTAAAGDADPEKDREIRSNQFLTNMRKHLASLKSANAANKLQQQQQQRHRPPRSESWGIRNSLRERLQGPKDTIVQAWAKAREGMRSHVAEKNPLRVELDHVEEHMRTNRHYGLRFLRPSLLVPLPGKLRHRDPVQPGDSPRLLLRRSEKSADYFYIERANHEPFDWEKEFKNLKEVRGPQVDYTKHQYEYPPLLSEPPSMGGYPKMDTLGNLMKKWPQDDLDHPPSPFVESLIHFNFSKPHELEMARKFRDMELPFKLYGVPELEAARVKWTDEYVASNFDRKHRKKDSKNKNFPPLAMGTTQESVNNYFAFFIMEIWSVEQMGLAPVRNNDWSFETWSKHARYADHVRLDPDQPHFYYQAGVERDERYRSQDEWTFISRDLPSMSSPSETFFVFHPKEQKGIQCRFGERGVTAATHYDSGRNMIAMITGAKRYILSPPKECSKLAIDINRRSSIYRHSLLNFGYISLLNDPQKLRGMSEEEQGWLERASTAQAVDTVLKAGEVLYIPSHWFHYITSVQKSAQCNVRSGIDEVGSREFGGLRDVLTCDAP